MWLDGRWNGVNKKRKQEKKKKSVNQSKVQMPQMNPVK